MHPDPAMITADGMKLSLEVVLASLHDATSALPRQYQAISVTDLLNLIVFREL